MRRPHDTSAEAWSRLIDAFRAMPARDRIGLALEMSEEVREIGRAGERHRSGSLPRTHSSRPSGGERRA